MNYQQWLNKIERIFQELGFPEKESAVKASKYRGLWRDNNCYTVPEKVVVIAMKQIQNRVDLENILYQKRCTALACKKNCKVNLISMNIPSIQKAMREVNLI